MEERNEKQPKAQLKQHLTQNSKQNLTKSFAFRDQLLSGLHIVLVYI